MIKIPFISVELCFALLWFSARAVVWLRQKRIDGKRELLMLLLYAHLALVLRFTFFPFNCGVDGMVQPLLFDPAKLFPMKIRLSPNVRLFGCLDSPEFWVNLIGNFTMLLPLGFLLPLLFPRFNRAWKVIAAGALLSLTIELLQLPFCTRFTDINDLILNTLGVAVGYAIYAGIRHYSERKDWGCWVKD